MFEAAYCLFSWLKLQGMTDDEVLTFYTQIWNKTLWEVSLYTDNMDGEMSSRTSSSVLLMDCVHI